MPTWKASAKFLEFFTPLLPQQHVTFGVSLKLYFFDPLFISCGGPIDIHWLFFVETKSKECVHNSRNDWNGARSCVKGVIKQSHKTNKVIFIVSGGRMCDELFREEISDNDNEETLEISIQGAIGGKRMESVEAMEVKRVGFVTLTKNIGVKRSN